MNQPSIFNDVIGPVMRGPSSSHCAAALRIGRLLFDLMQGEIDDVEVVFDKGGSLATTHKSQGSDMGLFAGLMGWDIIDERLVNAARFIQEAGIRIKFEIADLKDAHPSTYNIRIKNGSQKHSISAVSSGGGMIEIIRLDGADVSICGDYFETLIFAAEDSRNLAKWIEEECDVDDVTSIILDGTIILEIKSQGPLSEAILEKCRKGSGVSEITSMRPVLPVMSHKNALIPFLNCTEMLEYNRDKNLQLWELGVQYECKRGGLSEEQVLKKMLEIVGVLQKAVSDGLKGTKYSDRLLGHQSGKYLAGLDKGDLLEAGILNHMIVYVTAIMEVKSSMGIIVAAPTAGACAGLPGACLAAASQMDLTPEDIAKALLAAGMIGVFIAAHATFAAEVGGCQAECGAGSGMAAAALVSMAGGTLDQALAAASMAIQNTLGMICDPVANRVEVPCLGKNVLAAANALSCANMALAGFDQVIPLDEVIDTMDKVGKSIPGSLCCTALGGLSVTPTSKNLEKKLLHILQ